MELDRRQNVEASQRQEQQRLPWLIESNAFLQLSALEAEQQLQNELATNPALELEEGRICPRCFQTIRSIYCVSCRLNEISSVSAGANQDRFGQVITANLSEVFDPLAQLATPEDIRARIQIDVESALNEDDHPIAQYIIGSLDERGYLRESVAEIASRFGRPAAAVRRVLDVVQQLAPPGTAASSLSECLVLQLRYLTQSGEATPDLAIPLAENHLTELASHRYEALARMFKCPVAEIEQVHEFIRDRLNPYPLNISDAAAPATVREVAPAYPDVIFKVEEGELAVEVVGGDTDRLKINEQYLALARAIRPSRKRKGDQGSLSPEEERHVESAVKSAQRFIRKFQQRDQTLYSISKVIADLQSGFLLQGVSQLRPLTRFQVAQAAGVHESTVSRATAHKFAILPDGSMVPFSHFFTPSLAVKEVLKDLLQTTSDSGKPATDAELAEALAENGYRISRRTVAKYRSQLRVPSSFTR